MNVNLYVLDRMVEYRMKELDQHVIDAQRQRLVGHSRRASAPGRLFSRVRVLLAATLRRRQAVSAVPAAPAPCCAASVCCAAAAR